MLTRLAFPAFVLMCLAAAPAVAVPDRYKPMPSLSDEEFESIILRLKRNPPHLSADRLPDDIKIGRCLFVVHGRRLIDGPCSYLQVPGGKGAVTMFGPRQVFAGTDYPRPECYCQQISTDWAASVDPEHDDKGQPTGVWTINWGGEKEATHLQGNLGNGVRNGACVITKAAKACLWKEQSTK